MSTGQKRKKKKKREYQFRVGGGEEGNDFGHARGWELDLLTVIGRRVRLFCYHENQSLKVVDKLHINTEPGLTFSSLG